MQTEIIAMVISLIALCGLSGCGSSSKQTSAVTEIEANDSLPVAVKSVVKAVAEDDSTGFARMVSYPLQRPYPLRDINTPEEMQAYYKVLVDDSLRNIITHARPDRWSEYGWRGWSLDDGQYLWVEDGVYDVAYLSKAEKLQMDSLVEHEMKSLDPTMREGWRPEYCFNDTVAGTVYRVDARRDSVSKGHHGHHGLKGKRHGYRLAVYPKGYALSSAPQSVIDGDKDEEGTAGTTVYIFDDGHGRHMVIDPNPTDVSAPQLYDGNADPVSLKRVYWRDLIKK